MKKLKKFYLKNVDGTSHITFAQPYDSFHTIIRYIDTNKIEDILYTIEKAMFNCLCFHIEQKFTCHFICQLGLISSKKKGEQN